MILERHYDDESIISFLNGGDAAARDAHLAKCTVCSANLEEYRNLTSTLSGPCVWEPRELAEQPQAKTIAALRAFASGMSREDVSADVSVRDLLSGPREWWSNKLRQNPQYRTAGVVRKLIAATDKAIVTMPPDALEIATLAVDVAESLSPAAYPSDTVLKLRGAAWRERAYALFYTGQFSDSVSAADRADACYAQCAVSEYDQARVDLVRALAYRSLERFDEALALSSRSGRVFARSGDRPRAQMAMMIEAMLYAKTKQYAKSRDMWLDIRNDLPADADPATVARVTGSIAVCEMELGDLSSAMASFVAVERACDALNVKSEGARARWNIARVFLAQGQRETALRRLLDVKSEFEQLGMTCEAAIAGLDASEVLLEHNRVAEVQELCRSAMRNFETAGLTYTAHAMTALAYLQEAIHLGRATRPLVHHVRTYIRRLPQEPQLLFAPPPA